MTPLTLLLWLKTLTVGFCSFRWPVPVLPTLPSGCGATSLEVSWLDREAGTYRDQW